MCTKGKKKTFKKNQVSFVMCHMERHMSQALGGTAMDP